MNARVALTTLSCLALCACTSSNERPASDDGREGAGFLTFGSDSVYYETQGSGPAVVLIHGGFMDLRMWDDQLDALAEHFRVIRYDLRGFGRSSAPAQAYRPTEDLRALLEHLDVSSARIVGLSMGGGVAIDFAIAHPEMVEQLVVVSSGPNGAPVPEEERKRFSEIFEAGLNEGPEAAVEKWLSHPMLQAAAEQEDVWARVRSLVSQNGAFFARTFWPMEPLHPSAAGRIGEINVPTLVVVGERDAPIIHSTSDVLFRGVRGARKVVIREAGHLPNMEKPKEFNDALLRFFAKTPEASSPS